MGLTKQQKDDGRSHWVYFLRDSECRVVYVGMSSNPRTRSKSHQCKRRSLTLDVVLGPLPKRQAAIAERFLIDRHLAANPGGLQNMKPRSFPEKISQAELGRLSITEQVKAVLLNWIDRGGSVSDLSRATGLSRNSIYRVSRGHNVIADNAILMMNFMGYRMLVVMPDGNQHVLESENTPAPLLNATT